MVRQLVETDFRARRKILEPSDFALGDDQPDPPPSDLIEERVWDGIMTLPNDVAIRTTDHHGEKIALLYDLWGEWIDRMPAKGIPTWAMLDVADDFASSLFNLSHGYYKQAIAALRNALEVSVLACLCQLTNDPNPWEEWGRGKDMEFQSICKSAAKTSKILHLDGSARAAVGAGVFVDPADLKNSRAWSRNLYSRLSNFSHARSETANSGLWESNGPVYSATGLKVAYLLYLESYALMLILTKLMGVKRKLGSLGKRLLKKSEVPIYVPTPFVGVCLHYANQPRL